MTETESGTLFLPGTYDLTLRFESKAATAPGVVGLTRLLYGPQPDQFPAPFTQCPEKMLYFDPGTDEKAAIDHLLELNAGVNATNKCYDIVVGEIKTIHFHFTLSQPGHLFVILQNANTYGENIIKEGFKSVYHGMRTNGLPLSNIYLLSVPSAVDTTSCPDSLFFDYIDRGAVKKVILPAGYLWVAIDNIPDDHITIELNATDPDGTEYYFNLKLGETWTHPAGWRVKVAAIEAERVRVCVMPADLSIIPPPKRVGVCVRPDFELSLAYFYSLVGYISCLVLNIIAYIEWIVATLFALLPQLLSVFTYILSLKWITDFISQFFARLDVWLSEKFGIDPTLPFFEELVRKALTWISEKLNALTDEDSAKRGW